VANQGKHDRQSATAARDADDQRDQVDDDDSRVQQTVCKADPALAIDGFIPVRIACNSRSERRQEADENRQVGRRAPCLRALEHIDDVEEDRERPGANRDIGEDRGERMAEPGAVDESLEIMPGFAKQLVTATDELLREISDRLEPAL